MSLSSFSNSFSNSFSDSSYDSFSDASYDSTWTTDSDRWSPVIDNPWNRSDGHGGSSSAGAGAGATKDQQTESAFKRFSDLSVELRCLVWEHFCPELCKQPVILPFTIRKPPKPPKQQRRLGIAHGTKAVEDFVSRVRILLVLHRESHSLAIRRFPDKLQFRFKNNSQQVGFVPFDKHRDIVFIKSFLVAGRRDVQSDPQFQLPNFGQHVHKVVFRDSDVYRPDRQFFTLVAEFPNLKTLFLHHRTTLSNRLYTLPGWTWFQSAACFQAPSHRRLRCWPKTVEDLETAKLPVLLARLHFLVGKLAKQRGWDVLPMVGFETVEERKTSRKRIICDIDINMDKASMPSVESGSSPSSDLGPRGSRRRDRERKNSSMSDDRVPWWHWLEEWARDVDDAEKAAWAQGTEWMHWREWEINVEKVVTELAR